MAVKNFDVVITDLDGYPQKESFQVRDDNGNFITDAETKQPKTGLRDLTIAAAVVEVLRNKLAGDESLSYKEVFRLMDIADRIKQGGDTKIESDEITTIKERITKGWPFIVSYRVQQFLED